MGTSHQALETPCQDACQVMRLKVGDEDVLLAAIADGAGSASHSEVGSREAVQHVLKLVTRAELNLAAVGEEQIRSWFEGVLEHLKAVAESEEVLVDELACTLLLAIVWRRGAIFGQVGDGGWVLEKDGETIVGTWPETGEYANVTVFVTSKRALTKGEEGASNHLQVRRFEGSISALAGFSDGLQMLTLDYVNKVPFTRFFKAMWGPLRDAVEDTELIAPMQTMLASEMINSRTDDDKTLVLAVWRGPEAEVTIDGVAE
jgi:hypothetical protein